MQELLSRTRVCKSYIGVFWDHSLNEALFIEVYVSTAREKNISVAFSCLKYGTQKLDFSVLIRILLRNLFMYAYISKYLNTFNYILGSYN